VFLTRCLKEKVIPDTFIITLKLQHLNQEDTTKATNTLNQTSQTLIKLALQSRKTEIAHINKTYWDAWHSLFNLTQNQDITNNLKKLEDKIS
jgi:hypothetical protein